LHFAHDQELEIFGFKKGHQNFIPTILLPFLDKNLYFAGHLVLKEFL